MESKHHDSVTYFKELEKAINNRIHTYTNCHTFIHAWGKGLENHLDRVMIYRQIVTMWLTDLEIPNKDEIAAIAIKKVDYEDRVDELEETIFHLNKKVRENQLQIVKLKDSLEDLFRFFEPEVKKLQAYRLRTLKRELEDLKCLFNNDWEGE